MHFVRHTHQHFAYGNVQLGFSVDIECLIVKARDLTEETKDMHSFHKSAGPLKVKLHFGFLSTFRPFPVLSDIL